MSNDETREAAWRQSSQRFGSMTRVRRAGFDAGWAAALASVPVPTGWINAEGVKHDHPMPSCKGGYCEAVRDVGAVPTDTKELIATKLAEFCPAWSEAMCESLAGSIAAALSSLSPTQQEWEYGALAPNGLDMDVIGVESKVPVLDPPEAVYRRTPAGLWVLAPTDKEDN